MNNNLPRFGILGGLGPEASAYMYYEFTKRLLNRGIVKKNSEFPTIFIENVSIDFDDINGQTELGITESAKAIKNLDSNNTDFIAMCCNTIHLFRDKLIDESGCDKVLSIRDIMYSYLPKDKKICLLGSPATISCGLYDFEDLNYVSFTEDEKAQLWDILLNYSLRNKVDFYLKELENLIEKKQSEGAEFFLFCCTEISEIMNPSNILDSIKYGDTLEIYIDYLVEKCALKIESGDYSGLSY